MRTDMQKLYDTFDWLIDECEKQSLIKTAQSLRELRDLLPDVVEGDMPIDLPSERYT